MTATGVSPDSTGTQRWLPIQLNVNPNGVAVEWMDFGDDAIPEQFFSRTVERLRSMDAPAPERTSALDSLIEQARQLPERRPAGLIFHVSRCGSTLLCNVLRTAERIGILSEARPIERVFKPLALASSPIPREDWADHRRLLANSILALYAHPPDTLPLNILVKTCAVDMMQIPMIRSIWPEVPCVVLIRNPLDVLVSNLAGPSGWCERPETALRGHGRTFGEDWGDLSKMSVEEYLARGIGSFCKAALPSIGEGCRVVDYQSLSLSTIYKIAEFFRITMPDSESESVQRAITTDAKKFGLGQKVRGRQRAGNGAPRPKRRERWLERWRRSLTTTPLEGRGEVVTPASAAGDKETGRRT